MNQINLLFQTTICFRSKLFTIPSGRQSVAFMDFDILQLVDVKIIINGKFIEGKQIVQPKKQICYRLNVDSNEKLNKTKINESKIKKTCFQSH